MSSGTLVKLERYYNRFHMHSLEELRDHELVTFFYPMHSHKRAEECVMHELFHIVSDVSRHCGIDTEASAYMQGFVGVQILDFMRTKMDVCP